MEDYKRNSNKAKAEAEQKKVEKVVKGSAKVKKKSELKKLADTFIQEDAKTVGEYVFSDILVPAVKKTFADIVSNSLDMFLWGKTNSRNGTRRNGGTISYRSIYSQQNDRLRREPDRRRSYEIDDILIATREEAEDVLARMDELIADYGTVSIADYYDMVGITGRTTDNRYGWGDLRDATIVRDRDGYIIKLPRATVLD